MALFNFFKNKKKTTEATELQEQDHISEQSPASEQEDGIQHEQHGLYADAVSEDDTEQVPFEAEADIEQTPFEAEADIEQASLETEALVDDSVEPESETKPDTESAIESSADSSINPPVERKKNFFTKLFEDLSKTRKNIMDGINGIFGTFTKVDEEFFEELEETLIMADIGVTATSNIINSLRVKVKKERLTDVEQVRNALIEVITEILEEHSTDTIEMKYPSVVLVIGVNGVGKTTTIGKLASLYKSEGKKVIVAAADTFRAAAIDQLEVWAERSDIEIVKHQENSDPASVVYDAIQAAKARRADILICDTAGRLHNKKNLMDELNKIFRIINRDYPDAHKEVLLVLDATTGQNALQQAKLFKESADITGIVLTKLDGTAKGGIVISINSELNIPVKYIGIGEGINDLQPFSAKDFTRAIFGTVVS